MITIINYKEFKKWYETEKNIHNQKTQYFQMYRMTIDIMILLSSCHKSNMNGEIMWHCVVVWRYFVCFLNYTILFGPELPRVCNTIEQNKI